MEVGLPQLSCRYVGSGPCEVGLVEYTSVGQRAAFTEAEFRGVVLQATGGMFLPEPEFDSVGFTREELNAWGDAGERFNPPATFVVKLACAQEKVRLLRSGQQVTSILDTSPSRAGGR